MRKCFVLFLLIGLCNYIKAQETDEIKSIISTVTSSINVNHSLCTDNADFPNYLIKQLNIYLEKDTLLRLSIEEKKELQNKLLAAQYMPRWQESTVNGIPVIKSDSVKKNMGDSSKIWEYFKKKYPKPFTYGLYTFSRPIFIRNNTVCLFYYEESLYGGLDPWNNEEDTSSGELCIYMKIGNTWVKKVSVFRYIT